MLPLNELLDDIIKRSFAERVIILETISRSFKTESISVLTSKLAASALPDIMDLQGLLQPDNSSPPSDDEIEQAYGDYLAAKYLK